MLEVGCGTGRLAAALARVARVWAVDASPEMLAVARENVAAGVGLKLARAESLPFRDGWFDRVVARLVVHLLDRGAAFAEWRRVLGEDGRAAIATFDPAHFDAYWLNRFFPSLEAIDRARFPAAPVLEAELLAAGFASVELHRPVQRSATTRDEALAKIRERYISTLQLLDAGEHASGVERAERELPERIEYELRWLVAVAAV